MYEGALVLVGSCGIHVVSKCSNPNILVILII